MAPSMAFGPAVRRVPEVALEIAPLGPRAGGAGEHLLAYRVCRDFALPADVFQGVRSAIPGFGDDLAPGQVVSSRELREETSKRVVAGGLDALS